MTIKNSEVSANIASVMETWSLLDRTGFAISRLRELELGKCGLTIEQASILYILSSLKDGCSTPAELENVTMRQHHSVSVLTSGMEEAGLLQKLKFPDSKRLKIVITAEGNRLYRQTTIASIEESFSALCRNEQAKLLKFLTSLLQQSRYMLGWPADSPVKISEEAYNLKNDRQMHELWTLLDRSRFAISRLRGLELARCGLTIEQASILDILEKRVCTTARDLENITMRRQHSISSLLKGMIKMQIVTRSRDQNQKCFNIVITHSGQQLINGLIYDSLIEVFSVLSQNDKNTLAYLLNKLLERARYLLGISYQPPFLQHLSNGDISV